jgi:hypothetical protein
MLLKHDRINWIIPVIRHRKNVAESGMPTLKTQPIALAFSISAARKTTKKAQHSISQNRKPIKISS